MQKTVKPLLITAAAVVSLFSLLAFGIPYESVEATVARWVAQAYPEDSEISGVVLYESSQDASLSAFSGVTVYLYEKIDTDLSVITSTVTSLDGIYTFSNLPIGSYYLGYFGKTPENTYAYEYYNDVIETDEASPLTISFEGSQVTIPTVVLEGPASQLATVANSGGGNVYIDPITGQVFVNSPQSNVTLTVLNPCGAPTPTAISLFYNGRSFPMSLNSITEQYQGTITQDAITIASAEIFLDYTCPAGALRPAVIEAIGRITQFGSNGVVESDLIDSTLADAFVSLYHIEGATPDAGTASDGDCRTVNSRPNSSNWSGLSAATVDQTEFVSQTEMRTGGQADPPVNPQQTGENGEFGWGMTAGCYYVVVEADGYETQISPVFGILDTANVTDLAFELFPSHFYMMPIVSEDPNPFR
ncbi:MAG: hypothetical protein AAF633_02175 [Chloroflexota bacterium]